MEPFGIIYITSRVHRGVVVKKYVGQHRIRNGNVEDGYLGSGTLFKAALRKYGSRSFIRETLQYCYSKEELDNAEEFWISHLNCVADRSYYTISAGGLSPASPERKKVYQYSLEGKFVGSYTSIAEAAAAVGCNTPSITASCKGGGRTAMNFQWRFKKFRKIESTEFGNKRAISCYDLEGKFIRDFEGSKEAAKFCNRSGPNICHACNGKRREVGGYQWKYKDSDKVISKKRIQKKDTRGFYQIDPKTGNRIAHFISSTEAGSVLNLRSGSLSGAAKNGYLCGGFLWQYDDTDINPIDIRASERTIIIPTRILAYDLKGNFIQEFSGISEAAQHFQMNRRRISASACPTNRVRTACGYQFRYAGSDYPITDLTISVPGQRKSVVRKDSFKHFF